MKTFFQASGKLEGVTVYVLKFFLYRLLYEVFNLPCLLLFSVWTRCFMFSNRRHNRSQ